VEKAWSLLIQRWIVYLKQLIQVAQNIAQSLNTGKSKQQLAGFYIEATKRICANSVRGGKCFRHFFDLCVIQFEPCYLSAL